MFCSIKYNSMNFFTLHLLRQQNKGRMVLRTIRPNFQLRHSRAEQPRSGVAETLESMP